MTISYEDYIKPMVTFLRSLPEALRVCDDDPSLRYYGTGEAGHWAVQCNQQVLAGLAVLADVPDLEKYSCPMTADELRSLALSMFRYSMRTHITGDLKCTDGAQWGRHWISVLGLERATPGLNALYPYMTDEDRAMLKAVDLYEADYRLEDYPIEANIDGKTWKNKPESNAWNASFMFRAAANYPEEKDVAAWTEKAAKMMLAAVSRPSDATSVKLYRGQPLSELYVGPNFTENWSLDHHGYLNVGYIYVTLSNIALSYFNFLEHGQEVPPELLHNVKEVWEVTKKFTFPDGRLLRLGGDSRSRYTYCQLFAQQAWLLAAALFDDEDAVRFERLYLDKVLKEQAENSDGSFFGKRLATMKNESYYYYRRIEADPFFAMACGLAWRRKFKIRSEAAELPPKLNEPVDTWMEPFHGAVLRREGNVVRSVVVRGSANASRPGTNFHGHGPIAICAPLSRSDLADWQGNLFGFIGLMTADEVVHGESTPINGGFRWTCDNVIWERGQIGEGEQMYAVAKRNSTIVAISDGKTLVIADKVVMTKETTLNYGFRAMHMIVPNDVHNNYSRNWRGQKFSAVTKTNPGNESLVETYERTLNVDDAISVFAIHGATLKLHETANQNIFHNNGLRSMYADEVCMDCEMKPNRYAKGAVIFDVVYAVSADVTADETLAISNRFTITGAGEERTVEFIGFDGKKYTVKL